jgi:hypothetical protein
MLVPSPVRCLFAAVVIGSLSAGVALGRDDSRRERTNADDDPVVLPVWVAVPELTPRPQIVLRDPETTGSIAAASSIVAPKSPIARGCGRLAWYPERSPHNAYRALC